MRNVFLCGSLTHRAPLRPDTFAACAFTQQTKPHSQINNTRRQPPWTLKLLGKFFNSLI